MFKGNYLWKNSIYGNKAEGGLVFNEINMKPYMCGRIN